MFCAVKCRKYKCYRLTIGNFLSNGWSKNGSPKKNAMLKHHSKTRKISPILTYIILFVVSGDDVSPVKIICLKLNSIHNY